MTVLHGTHSRLRPGAGRWWGPDCGKSAAIHAIAFFRDMQHTSADPARSYPAEISARTRGAPGRWRPRRGPAAPRGGRRGRGWAPRWTIRGALGGRGHGQRGALWGPFRVGVRAVAGKDHPQNQRQA